MLSQLVEAAGKTARQHQVVISLRDEGVFGGSLRAAGVELHCLHMTGPLTLPPALWKLTKILRKTRPEVVMTWLYHADLMGTLAAFLTGTRRLVWNLRCSKMDFANSHRSTAWIVRLLARISRRPWAVSFNSHTGQRDHQKLGYRPQRWVYLPNGFDPDQWRPDPEQRRAVRAQWKLEPGAVAIGMVARVAPQKDHANFLRAAQQIAPRHPQVRFILIGKGTERLPLPPALAGRVLALGERHDVDRLLRGLDIFVLASLFGEGLPNVVGEAMSTGLPCVVTDVGDSQDLLGDGGLAVPRGDTEALVRALTAITTMLPEERAALGARGRARIEEHFTLALAESRYQELWEEASRP